MNKRETSTARLEARLPKSVLALIKKAAELEGRSISEFVVGSARQAAHQSIEAHSKLNLSRAAQIEFAEALLNPETPPSSLKKAAVRHRKLLHSENS